MSTNDEKKDAPAEPDLHETGRPAESATPVAAEAASPESPQSVKPAELQKKTAVTGKPLDLDFILDIPLQVKVEVGRARMMIQEMLQLGKGSVIELNKLLGEPFEVMVNDKLVARGEVVVVNDRFGVRLTDIISPNERVQTLA
jgi:flagellar motor switch protein FliN